ncbi:MAG: class I SAM-dependent methyltransferase [Flavobacteriales bacterium]
MQIFLANPWSDYELIDSGNRLKLERFGEIILIRPEQQAIWQPEQPLLVWKKQAHFFFDASGAKDGRWIELKKAPRLWHIAYPKLQLNFKLELTRFKHIGLFPEQQVNWNFIYDSVKRMKSSQPKILNLFAYTGASSLAAKAAGAEVYHVDSIKQVVSWANENRQLSKLEDIRWVVEDALSFAQKEVKRRKKYNGIIMDPPSFGLGKNAEKWKLEDKLNELLQTAAALLDSKEHFFVINTYSAGLSALVMENCLRDYINTTNCESGELHLHSKSGKNIPLGHLLRFRKG